MSSVLAYNPEHSPWEQHWRLRSVYGWVKHSRCRSTAKFSTSPSCHASTQDPLLKGARGHSRHAILSVHAREPRAPGSSWVCHYCCPAGGSHSAQQCDHSLPNWFQSKWQGYTSARLVLVTRVSCCRAGETECPREEHPQNLLLSSGTLHLPTVVCLGRKASTVAAAHENSILAWYQFCYIWQHSNSKPELQFQYTTPAEP